MLITIRSGVVFLRVDGPKSFKKLDGSAIGASTYLGLLKLLTNYKYPDEGLKGALEGDNNTVDMTVGDIYGTNYSTVGLSSQIIACSFGKARKKALDELGEIKNCDISRSLLTMIVGNMLQIASLIANLENLSTIVLMGSHFDAPEVMQMSTVSMEYMTEGKKSLIFVKHSSYLGSLGVYLNNLLQRERINTI